MVFIGTMHYYYNYYLNKELHLPSRIPFYCRNRFPGCLPDARERKKPPEVEGNLHNHGTNTCTTEPEFAPKAAFCEVN